MSDLAGASTNGTWTLNVYDCAGGPSGQVDDWAITFDTPLPTTPYTYAWTPTAGIVDPSAENTIFSSVGFPVSTVTKTMTAVDDNGCTGSRDVVIEIIDCTILLNLEQPLTLLNFKGKKEEDDNLLEWEVSTDANTDFYILERSTDGINFEQLKLISTANTNVYSFLDVYPGLGTKYYRLKVVQIDGGFEYSKTIVLTHATTRTLDGFAVFPNPTKGTFYIAFDSEVTSEMEFEIQNTMGQILLEGKQSVKIGRNKLELNLDAMPPATYILSATLNDYQVQRKLIKQ